jgi:hypothetical protein
MHNSYNKRNSNVTVDHVTSQDNKLTTISISYNNYLKLKKLGGAGDSFNDVISGMLRRLDNIG